MFVDKTKIITGILGCMAYVIWLIAYEIMQNKLKVTKQDIFIVSWVGIIILLAILVQWKQLTHDWLNLWSLYYLFFALFNFSQSFLWAFGIHTNLRNEFGNSNLYETINYTDKTVISAQMIFIICLITFNFGAVIAYNKSQAQCISKKRFDFNEIDSMQLDLLFRTALFMLVISMPATFYISLRNLVYSQIYSYHDLYYGDIKNVGKIVGILDTFFFPALVGVLIGGGYKRNVRWGVYMVFGLYAIITLLCGDRGEWILKLAVLFWADHYFNRPKEAKTMIKWGVIGFVGLYVMSAIVELRNIGLSVAGFKANLFSPSNNPIISMIVEFGHSMGISMIMIEQDVVFPYGNTYLMSLLTAFGTGIFNKITGMDYVQLGTWFSRDYLGITFGADFSIIGEALLNFGIYFAPIFFVVIGFIISKIFFLPYRYKENPLCICLVVGAMEPLIKMTRSTLWYALGRCIYFVCGFCIVYWCWVSLEKRRFD